MMTLQFDGLFRSEGHNACGFMCYGWVIMRGGFVTAHGHGVYARPENASASNAEYLALIEGLEFLLDMGAAQQKIEVIGDAKSIIYQMQGFCGVSSASVRPFFLRASKLAGQFARLSWRWKPRKENRMADALTRRALRQMHADPRCYANALQALQPGRDAPSAMKLQPIMDLSVFQPQRV